LSQGKEKNVAKQPSKHAKENAVILVYTRDEHVDKRKQNRKETPTPEEKERGETHIPYAHGKSTEKNEFVYITEVGEGECYSSTGLKRRAQNPVVGSELGSRTLETERGKSTMSLRGR